VSEYHKNELTARSRVLQNLRVSHLVKKFPTHHGTRRLTTAFTRTRQLFLPRARSSPTPSQPISSRSIATLHSHSCLDLPSGPFLSVFPVKTRMPFSFRMCHMPSPTHRPNNFWRRTNHDSQLRFFFFTFCPYLPLRPTYVHIRDIHIYNF